MQNQSSIVRGVVDRAQYSNHHITSVPIFLESIIIFPRAVTSPFLHSDSITSLIFVDLSPLFIAL